MGVNSVRWKVGIVGAGYMAQEHAKAFASVPDVTIVGVCGRSRPRAEALAAAHGVPAFPTVTSLFEATKPDAVVIAVNELSAEPVCREAFQFPWLILAEKPVGVDLPQAKAILEECQAARARCYVGLNRRAYASTRFALERLGSDESPRLISVLDQQDMSAALASGQPEEVVRNWMYANSIHLVDYLSLFARGIVVRVEQILPWAPSRPSAVVAAVHYSGGDTGIYQAVWDGPGPWAATVTNRHFRLEMRPLERVTIQLRGERKVTEVVQDPIDVEYKAGLRYQAGQAVATLGGDTTTLPTLAEATRSMELCAQIYGI